MSAVTRPLTVLLLATALLAPATAAAKGGATLAPPGNSAVTEYLETVPNAEGASPLRQGAPRSAVLGVSARRALVRLGPDGRTLAAVADATAPPAVPSPAGGHGGGARPVVLSAAGVPSRAGALLAAATGRDGGGGLGPALPALMAAGLLWALVHARRRRGGAGRS